MGYLQTLLKDYREKKKQQKEQPQQEIQEYIETEKMRNRIDFIKKWEKDSFLYGRGNENEQQ